MTEQQKAAIEEAAKEKYPEYVETSSYYHTVFRQGAQEVIEHPKQYGLYTKEQYEQALKSGYNQGLSDGARQTVDYLNKNILK